MAEHAHTTGRDIASRTRRKLLVGTASAAAGAGIAALVLAPDPSWGAPDATVDPDAELIATCMRFAEQETEWEYLYITAEPGEEDDEVRTDYAALKFIKATPAHTLHGCVAKAIAVWAAPWERHEIEGILTEGDTYPMTSSVMRDLAEPAMIAMFARLIAKHGKPLPSYYTPSGRFLGYDA